MKSVHSLVLEWKDLFSSGEGRFAGVLEKAMKAKDVAFTSSGTNAIILALKDAGLRSSDEVVVPGYTCRAVPDAVRAVCKPVFADVDGRTFNIDPARISKRIGARTRAVIAVHSYGSPCEMGEIRELADRKGLVLIEDCAQALLGTWKGKPLGSFGNYAILSFRFSKDITCYKGGALLSKEGIKARPQRLPHIDMAGAKLAAVKTAESFLRMAPGAAHTLALKAASDAKPGDEEASLTAYQLSILQAQFERLPRAIERRRANAAVYRKRLEGAPLALQQETGRGHTYLRFTARHKDADALQSFLLRRGVEADRMYAYSISQEPESKRLASEALNLPVHQNLKRSDINEIAEVVHGFF